MAKYIVINPVQHDGKEYAEGDTIEVSDKAQADALLAAGAVAEQVKAKAKPAAAE